MHVGRMGGELCLLAALTAYLATGQGSRAILFAVRRCSVVKGHTCEESGRGIGVIMCGGVSLFWAC